MASSKIFSLEGKGLKLDTAEDIESHIKELRDNTGVEEVRFQGNTLGIGSCEALAKVLETKKNLQIANLADIFTSRLLSEIPPALSALLTALLTLPKLHTVNLSDNAFGLNTQEPLVAFLSAHVPLKHLILNNNGLGPNAGTLIADALSTLAAKKKESNAPQLETVVCGRNRLENGSMEAWAKAVAAHAGGLREIKMVQNGIRQEGITALIRDGLAQASGLRVLDLQDNTFTAMGAGALSRAVGGWTELQELGVGDCLLSARGGIMLGEALAAGKNAQLEVLRLQYNEIGTKAVRNLALATGKLPRLRRVELNGNAFSEDEEAIEEIRTKLNELRKNEGPPMDEETEEWGLDELDELDDEDSEEEGEDEDEVEEEQDADAEEKGARKVKEDEEAEEENVAQKKDKSVDQLADMLGKTEI